MKVTVCVGASKLLIPVGDGQRPVSWLVSEAEKRATAKLGKEPGIKEIQTEAGETLYAEDMLADLVEDGAQLIAIATDVACAAAQPAASNATSVASSEAVLACVQCGASYKESENADGACRFHKRMKERSGWNGRYPCCYARDPCGSSRHRSQHHSEFPYEAFFELAQTIYPALVDMWAKFERVDMTDGVRKWLEVGTLSEDRVFARAYNGSDVVGLRVLSHDELRGLAAGAAIISQGSESNGESLWFDVRVVKPGTIRAAFRVPSDSVPFERMVSYQTDPKPEMVGAEDCSAPPPFTYDNWQTGAIEVAKHQCEGTSALRMTMDEPTFANQDPWARDGTFKQYFINTVTISNPTSQDLTVTAIGSECKIGPSFVPAAKTLAGYSCGDQMYEFRDSPLPLKIAANDAVKIAVSTAIDVNGTPGQSNDTRQRAHQSLPQPFRVRIVAEDAVGNKVSLVCEQANGPLNLKTEAQVAMSVPRMFGYLQCDDTEQLTRNFVAFGVSVLGQIVVQHPNQSTHLRLCDLAYYAYNAVRAGTEVFELADACNNGTKVYALVDLAKQQVYGLRATMTSATGAAEGEFAVPNLVDLWNSISVTAEPSQAKPGSKVKVSWRALGEDSNARVCLYKRIKVNGYYSDAQSATAAEGEAEFTVPQEPGEYDIRLHPGGDYDLSVHSNVIVVQ
eukprot:m51a1_g756 hypothetical protein (679) ;mRNA; f:533033-535453